VTDTPGANPRRGLGELRELVDAADRSVSEAITATTTPRLDRVLVNLSDTANHSRL